MWDKKTIIEEVRKINEDLKKMPNRYYESYRGSHPRTTDSVLVDRYIADFGMENVADNLIRLYGENLPEVIFTVPRKYSEGSHTKELAKALDDKGYKREVRETYPPSGLTVYVGDQEPSPGFCDLSARIEGIARKEGIVEFFQAPNPRINWNVGKVLINCFELTRELIYTPVGTIVESPSPRRVGYYRRKGFIIP